jgi:hypothetical protein
MEIVKLGRIIMGQEKEKELQLRFLFLEVCGTE